MISLEISYTAEPTLALFHKDNSFYRGVRGPVRSGKSTGMSVEIMARAGKQKASSSGIRRTRWAVIRNTYRELEDTTLRTWLMWFPEMVFGSVNRRTMTHIIQVNDIYMEVMFRALDRADDVKKLLSLELTGAWVNEAKEVPKAIIDVLGDRVEQYPPKMDEGCTWGGVFMDTNSPDEDHWWHELEAKPPKGWSFFAQPGALREVKGRFLPNPKAENIRNLNGGHDYYVKRMEGKKDSYIRVYYCNQYGYVEDGKRVHPNYSDATHCSPSPLVPDPRFEVFVGLDFGLTPAAAFCQRNARGQWRIFHEIATEDLGIKHFGEMLLLPYILSELSDFKVSMFGDPSGSGGSIIDKQTPFQILDVLGFKVGPAPSQDPMLRREALEAPLGRLIDGEPGLLIDPSCKILRKGLSSKFIYKRVQVVGDEKFHDEPDKNFWSHVCEALEYAMVGAGEGKAITRKPSQPRTPKIHKGYASKSKGWMAG